MAFVQALPVTHPIRALMHLWCCEFQLQDFTFLCPFGFVFL